MELTGLVLTLSSLIVSPDRSQFFKYESLSLSCEDNTRRSGWRVKAKTVRGVSECGLDWGSLQPPSCIINEAYSWNSGAYWCESTSGETSPAVNITVTETNVILESPVRPVVEGDSVTLVCTSRRNSSDVQATVFMKGRSPVGAGITGRMTIPAASRSDEGFYMCMIPDVGASAQSWLAVPSKRAAAGEEGQTSDGFSTNVAEGSDGDALAAPFLSVSRLISHLLVGTPYLLSTVLLGLICRDKHKNVPAVQKTEEMRRDADVQMEEIK